MFCQTQENYKIDTGLRASPYHEDNLPFPNFEKPTAVGFFSVTPERNYEPTARNLRYYKAPTSFPFDLNIGAPLPIKKPGSFYDEGINHLLMFISDYKAQFLRPADQTTKPGIAAEFICWSGLLRLLMCTPYELRQDWCIHVTKYLDTFYLCKRDSKNDQHQLSKVNVEQKRMKAWGHKFEQYCLSDSPHVEPNPSAPVDERAEFCYVFKSKVKGMEILYGSKMEGIISDKPVQFDENNNLQNLKFVELKVRQADLNRRQQQFYKRFKTRNWWCQSFLVGVQDLYVGRRTDKGLVKRIEHVELHTLPKQGINYWTPTVCANFLIQFFTVLKEVMATENCPYTVYAFHFDSNTCRVNYESLKGKTENSFLPDWYISMLQQLAHPNEEVSVR